MCKPSGNSTTTSQTTGPPANVLQNYQDVYNMARGVAGTGAGAQSYPGQSVAPLSQLQQMGMNSVAAGGGWGDYMNAAAGQYGNATTDIWGGTLPGAFNESTAPAWTSDIAKNYGDSSLTSWTPGVAQNYGPQGAQAYLSPYIQSVIDATQNQFNNQNQIQQQGVIGNAIASNAWGGDRSGVAQGITAGQQQLSQAPVIAGLYNQGYQQAQRAAQTAGQAELGATEAQRQRLAQVAQAQLQAQEQQRGLQGQAAQAQLGATEANRWLSSQAAAGLAGIGNSALSAQTQLGGLQQQQGQAELNVPYANWLRSTSYPYQATNWLANIAEGTGSLSGGIGATTTPGPSTFSQVAGLGAAGLGIAGATGAFGSNGWLTGGGGPTSSGGGPGDWLGGGDWSSAAARGGAISHRGVGGRSPPMGSDIPDLSMSMIPAGIAPTGGGNFMKNMAVTNTTQSGGGGGGSDAGSTALGVIGTVAKFAPLLALLNRGGGIRGYDPGGAVELPDVDINADAPSAGIAPAMTPISYGGNGIVSASPMVDRPYKADPWMALAAAGFGAAAGRSPFALQNIGAGGLEGMKFYNEQREAEPTLNLRQAQAERARMESELFRAQVNYNPDSQGTQPTATSPPAQFSQSDDLDTLMGHVAGERKMASASPATSAAVGGRGADPRGLIPFIAQTAAKYGIDPAVAVRVASTEGLSAPPGPSGDGGTSGSAFQLHVTPGGKGNSVGDQFRAQTGLDPLDPANEKATIDFALRHASQNGWSAFRGSANAGIQPFQGIHSASAGPQVAQAGPDQYTTAINAQLADLQAQARGIRNMPATYADKAKLLAPITERITTLMANTPQGAAARAAAVAKAEMGPKVETARQEAIAQGNVKLDVAGQMIPIQGAAAGAEAAARVGPALQEATGKAGIDIAKEMQTPRAVTTEEPSGEKKVQYLTPTEIRAKSAEAAGLTTEQPTAVKAQLKSADTEYEESVKESKTAQENRLPLQAIENASANYRTGTTGEPRLRLLKAWQDLAQTLHLPADSELAKTIASGEVINKEGTYLGFGLARTLGSREAQNIVSQAITANPGLFNTPAGNKQLIGIIRVGLQRADDKRNFFDSWVAGAPDNNRRSFVGASDAFNKAHPPEAYINRVIPPRHPPTGVPDGAVYNGARGQWRDPQGVLYNAAGIRMQP